MLGSRAAITKAASRGTENNRSVLSPSSEGQKSEIEVSETHVPSEGSREGSVPGLSPSFWEPQHSLADLLAVSLHITFPPSVCILITHFISQSYWIRNSF